MAAEKAIQEWGGPKDEITHISGITSTGMAVPGIEFHVISKLGLPRTTQRVSVTLMGSNGAGAGLQLAAAFAMQSSQSRVLVVCCDMPLVAAAGVGDLRANEALIPLYGDGASAVVIGSMLRSGESAVYEYLAGRSEILPNTDDLESFTCSKEGVEISFSADIPRRICHKIPDFVDNLSMAAFGQHIPFDQMLWPVHPTALPYISMFEEACALDPDLSTMASRECLRKFGNMYGASLFFVLDDLRRRPPTVQCAVTASIAPGLAMEGDIFKICHGDGQMDTAEGVVRRILEQRDEHMPSHFPLPPAVPMRYTLENPHILGIGTANPENVIPTIEAAEGMINFYRENITEKEARRLRRIARTCGIDQRRSVITLEVSKDAAQATHRICIVIGCLMCVGAECTGRGAEARRG